MPEVRRGGKRRLDRVLAPEYSDGLPGLPAGALRSRRTEAELEAAELTELIVLLHGRVEVLTAELRHRGSRGSRAWRASGAAATPEPDAVGHDGARRAGGFWPRSAPEPGRTDRRRRVERLVVDVDLADVAARTDDELERVLRTYRAEEERVLVLRSQVRQVAERCGEELARRGVAGSERRAATTPAARDDR